MFTRLSEPLSSFLRTVALVFIVSPPAGVLKKLSVFKWVYDLRLMVHKNTFETVQAFKGHWQRWQLSCNIFVYVCVKGMTFSAPGPGLKTSLKISESKELLHFIGSRGQIRLWCCCWNSCCASEKIKKVSRSVHHEAYIKGSKDKWGFDVICYVIQIGCD